MFDKLPNELLGEIFFHITPESIAKLSRVNKQLRKVTTDANQLWQMKFERHFPHIYKTIKHDNEPINWLAEFQQTYKDEYKDVPIRVRKIFSLIKESDIEGLRQVKIPSLEILDYKDKHGKSLLMIAQTINNTAVLDYLYQTAVKFHTFYTRDKHSINTQKKDKYNRTILYWAIQCHQDDKEIQSLLNQGSRLNELYHIDNMNNDLGLPPIHVAARVGNLGAVTTFINQNHSLLEQRDTLDQTPLICAAALGQLEVVDYLLNNGADVNVTTNNPGTLEHGRTALYWAVVHGHNEVVARLINAGAITTTALGLQRYQPIHVAAKGGDLKVVKALIESDISLLEQMDAFGQTPLLWAASNGHREIVDYLINKGARVDAATNNPGRLVHGRTSLYWAVVHGHSEVVARLITAGATTTTTLGQKRYQPIHVAAKEGNLSVVKALIENDDKLLEQMDALHQTPLLWAAREGHIEVVNYLLSKGANVDVATNKPRKFDDGRTPLDWAVFHGHNEIVASLIKAGASTTTLGSEQQPIHFAAKEGKLTIVKLLIESDSTLLEKMDNLNQTPLLWAAANGYWRVVNYLISKGAKVDVATHKPSHPNHGRTPLDWAVSAGYKRTEDILRLFNYCSRIGDAPQIQMDDFKHIEIFYNEFIQGWKMEIKNLANSKMSNYSKASCLETLAALDKKLRDEVITEKDSSGKYQKIIQHITLLIALNKVSQQIDKDATSNETFIMELLKNENVSAEYKQAFIPMLNRILIKDETTDTVSYQKQSQTIHMEFLQKQLQDSIEMIEGYLKRRKNKIGFFFNSRKDYEKRQSSWDNIQELMNGHQDKKTFMTILNHDIERFSHGYFTHEYSTLLQKFKAAMNDYGQYERFTFTYNATKPSSFHS